MDYSLSFVKNYWAYRPTELKEKAAEGFNLTELDSLESKSLTREKVLELMKEGNRRIAEAIKKADSLYKFGNSAFTLYKVTFTLQAKTDKDLNKEKRTVFLDKNYLSEFIPKL